VSVLPSANLTTSAPTTSLFSGLDHTACTLPVYASPRTLPHATQHSVPAAGQALPGGIGYPPGSIRRFRYSGPPSPGFPGARDFESFSTTQRASVVNPDCSHRPPNSRSRNRDSAPPTRTAQSVAIIGNKQKARKLSPRATPLTGRCVEFRQKRIGSPSGTLCVKKKRDTGAISSEENRLAYWRDRV